MILSGKSVGDIQVHVYNSLVCFHPSEVFLKAKITESLEHKRRNVCTVHKENRSQSSRIESKKWREKKEQKEGLSQNVCMKNRKLTISIIFSNGGS